MLLSRESVYRGLLLVAVFNYRQLCFGAFEGESKKPAEVVATHQPSTVNTQKGGLGEKSVIAPWESSSTGAQK